jgi:hypothetical protein
MTMNWRGKQFIQKITDKVEGNLDRASIALVAGIKESFGSPSKMPKGQRTPVRGYRMKAKTYRGYQHSLPGQAPFIQTGNLKRSITYDKPESLIRRVGSTMKQDNKGYALWLELGTQKIKPRPYLRPMLNKMRGRLASIVAGKA